MTLPTTLPTTLHDAAHSTGLVPIDLAPLTTFRPAPGTGAPTRSPDEIASEVLGTPTTLVSSKPPTTPPITTPTLSSLFAAIAIAAGIALLAWAAWHGTRRSRRAAVQHRSAQPGGSSTPQPAVQSQHQHAQLLMAADQIAKQLDARAAQLERVLAAADARIAQLERTPSAASSIPQAVPPQRHAPRSASTHQPAMAEAKPLPNGSAPSPNSFPPPPFTTPLAAPLTPPASHRDVYDLADEGLTPVQIAQRLAKPTGQIELILNLRKAAMSS